MHWVFPYVLWQACGCMPVKLCTDSVTVSVGRTRRGGGVPKHGGVPLIQTASVAPPTISQRFKAQAEPEELYTVPLKKVN